MNLDMFNVSSIGMAVVNSQDEFCQVNKCFCEMLGYEQKELIGKKPKDLLSEEDFQKDISVVRKLREKKIEKSVNEYKHFRKDGSIMWGLVSQTLHNDSDGKVYCIVQVQDITPQKITEKLLRDSKAYLDAILEVAPSAIYTVDLNQNIIEWNKMAEKVTGYSKGEIFRKKCGTFSMGPCPDNCSMKNSSVNKPVFNVEFQLRRKDGEIINIEKNLNIMKDVDGNVVGGIESFQDVTWRKKAEEELKEREEKYKTLFEAASDAIMLLKTTGQIIDANQSALNMFKVSTKDEFLKYTPAKLSPKIQPDGMKSQDKMIGMLDVLLKEGICHFEWSHTRMNGEAFVAHVLLTKMIIHGEIILQATLRDITEEKIAENELKEAMRIKSDFTSNVSHELRTPLGPIKEGAQIILDGIEGEVNDGQKMLLEMIVKNAKRLNRLINDILDFQKLQAGKMDLNLKEQRINEVVKEVYESMVLMTNKKNLGFELNLQDDLPLIKIDADKISQVLVNLVNNAIKFTDAGMVKIETSSDEKFICVKVIDTGIGISEKDLEKLFQCFQQLDNHDGIKRGGTGLGLAISKEIVKLHLGDIMVESEVGKGTTIYFTLPIEESHFWYI